jgi:hypothetical protein
MFTHKQLVALADDVLDRFPNINYGGCGIFAAIVAKEIQHHFKVRIVAFSSQKEKDRADIDYVRDMCQPSDIYDWKYNGCEFQHIAIEITDNNGRLWHYDASGLFPADGDICICKYNQLSGSLTIKEIEQLANSSIGWCDDFDRRLIPGLKSIIHKHFYGNPTPSLTATIKNAFMSTGASPYWQEQQAYK